jgi:hypothetical protein
MFVALSNNLTFQADFWQDTQDGDASPRRLNKESIISEPQLDWACTKWHHLRFSFFRPSPCSPSSR